jgi:glucose-6-phosphate isomerase
MALSPAVANLVEEYKRFNKTTMNELFALDNNRAEKYTIEFEDLIFDYSKNRFDDKVLSALIKLAEEHNLKNRINDMFTGKKINVTENRAVLHTALRNFSDTPIYVDNVDVMPEIRRVREKMKTFSEAVRNGTFRGFTGKKLINIVNIGIGGSDLGPYMVTAALKKYWAKDIKCYFISNIDGTACAEVLNEVNPEETLFIVASKTFTTIETLTNARTCRDWLVKALGEQAVANHFVALSTNTKAVAEFGINTDNMFEFWDFVGGRYSLWSAIGLSIALAVGYDNFEALLKGAEAMDNHFKTAPLDKNIPVIMALLGIWYNDYYNIHRYGVIPYDQYLKFLPSYLQQLDMESNGKSVRLDNKKITDYATGPALFGGAGTDVQHSFFQLLHQGTEPVPVDFIIPAVSQNENGKHHEILLANILAQAEALMKGKTTEEAAAELRAAGKDEATIEKLKLNKSFDGNRPSNMFIINQLTPYNLGMLIAMYEHKVYTQGVIWEIDSFDQWGVELGKQLALKILPELENGVTANHDSSTTRLINKVRAIRAKAVTKAA